jgi:hypothetical protein
VTTASVRRRFELDWLDVKLAGALGLVTVPLLDDKLGGVALSEELDRLLQRVVDDGLEAHCGSLSRGLHRGLHGTHTSGMPDTNDPRNQAVSAQPRDLLWPREESERPANHGFLAAEVGTGVGTVRARLVTNHASNPA